MRILITGNKGFIGRVVSKELENSGFEIEGFDITEGNDILNYKSLYNKMNGCQLVVHLAAIESTNDIDTMNANLQGTWNVLQSARNNRIQKIVFTSSVDVLGVFQGENNPIYLPLDDKYPCHPKSTYSISKIPAESMCQYFYNATRINLFIIRPPGVWDENTYIKIQSARKARPKYEWDPYWEYGAFIDVRDLARAIRMALEPKISGFHKYLIASDDITTSGMTSLELVQKLLPKVEWKGGKEYKEKPYKSLIITEGIKQLLNWGPEYSWARYKEKAL
jgi:UDP-glucose 4-epimerase